MSLDFSYEKCNTLPNGDDPKHHPFDETKWHAVGDALVWMSLSVGIGELSDKTIDKWERRINILQRLDGPMLRVRLNGETQKVLITRADLEAFKGLRTNARYAPYETDAAWLKRIFGARDFNKIKTEQAPAYEIAHEAAFQGSGGVTKKHEDE